MNSSAFFGRLTFISCGGINFVQQKKYSVHVNCIWIWIFIALIFPLKKMYGEIRIAFVPQNVQYSIQMHLRWWHTPLIGLKCLLNSHIFVLSIDQCFFAKLFRRRGRTRRFYFSVHYVTLYNQLILLEFLLLYFQVSCYLVAFKIAAVEKTCSHHDWLHLDCCIKFNHSMGIVFSIGAIVSRLGYNAMSWGVATRTRWFHVFSHCKCVCMLFSSNVVDITLLHSDLDKSLQALHSGRFKRCTNGSDATKIQDQSR